MNDLQIDNWVKEGILPSISEIDESQVEKIDENRLVLFKDMSDDDSYKDLFLFTNGEQLPKQTFWISKDYIKNIINK